MELLEKLDGCIGKVSSAIGVSPSALKAWAASKEKGLLPKQIAAGSRKRYYKGRTEEDVAEILDYYFSHANKRQAAPLGKRKTPAGFSGGKGQMEMDFTL